MASIPLLVNEVERINLHCRHNSVTQEECSGPTLRQAR